MNASACAKVVAIDGPGGSGKSSAARKLAERLGFFYVDSGATYRALALGIQRAGVDLDNSRELAQFLASFRLEYAPGPGVLVALNGVDVTREIRRHEVSALASRTSTIPRVREFLVSLQRRLAPGSGCVMEGRDIGTVVFPDAFAKFFVTAPPRVRAERRWRDMEGVDLEQVVRDEEERDLRDTSRDCDPLRRAEGAVVLDTGEMNLDQVVDALEEGCRVAAKKVGLHLVRGGNT